MSFLAAVQLSHLCFQAEAVEQGSDGLPDCSLQRRSRVTIAVFIFACKIIFVAVHLLEALRMSSALATSAYISLLW